MPRVTQVCNVTTGKNINFECDIGTGIDGLFFAPMEKTPKS